MSLAAIGAILIWTGVILINFALSVGQLTSSKKQLAKLPCRVSWKNLRTGFKGHGSYTKKSLAEAWTDYGNRTWRNEIDHKIQYKILSTRVILKALPLTIFNIIKGFIIGFVGIAIIIHKACQVSYWLYIFAYIGIASYMHKRSI